MQTSVHYHQADHALGSLGVRALAELRSQLNPASSMYSQILCSCC
eukprot:COSAG06_NODE_2378_length_6982_cov_36.074531_7_plen_45_part_00